MDPNNLINGLGSIIKKLETELKINNLSVSYIPSFNEDYDLLDIYINETQNVKYVRWHEDMRWYEVIGLDQDEKFILEDTL